MISDNSENITGIDWTVYGKVSSVTKSDGSNTQFLYDAAGNRIKKSYTDINDITTNTYYVRDASGNIMAVYDDLEEDIEGGTEVIYSLREQPIYGSDRLGQRNANFEVQRIRHLLGETPYEVNNVDFEGGLNNWLLPISSQTGTALAHLDMSASPALEGETPPIGSADLQQIAVAEDDNGNLLFSLAVAETLHGSKKRVALVLDANGNIMPGTLNLGETGIKAAANGAALVAKTKEGNMVYKIFTIDDDHKAYVHTVDMSLPGNGSAMGEVVRKNEPLDHNFNFLQAMTLMEDRQFECPVIHLYMVGYDPGEPLEGAKTLNLQHYALAGTALSGNTVDSWTGYAGYGQIAFSKSGDQLAVVTPKGQPLGWYEASNDGANLRLYDFNLLENEVTNLREATIGDDIVVNSMDFNADGDYIYYTSSGPEEGHKVNRAN